MRAHSDERGLMGLFRKKPKKDQVDQVQAALAVMQARINTAEQAKTVLESQLSALGAANSALSEQVATLDQASSTLDSRIGALDHGFTMMGDQLYSIASTNTTLNQRLNTIDDLGDQVRGLAERLDTPPPATPVLHTPPPAPPAPAPTPMPPPPPTDDGDDGRIDAMAAQLEDLAVAVAMHSEQMATARARMDDVDELAALLEEAAAAELDDDRDGSANESVQADVAALREQLTDVSNQMSTMDGRVTAVSTELANQLTELSRDIDELSRRAAATEAAAATVDDIDDIVTTAELEARLAERLDAAIDDVLDTTEKLAAEQARYEIQFRADLAELAERLRRPGAG